MFGTFMSLSGLFSYVDVVVSFSDGAGDAI